MMQRLASAMIVPAGPGDAEALARLHVETWRETYPGLLPAGYLSDMDLARHAKRWRSQLTSSKPPSPILVAEQRGGLVAYCAGARGEGTRGEVFTLYVLKRWQGTGLGAELLRDMARVLRARGATSLHLWVLSSNVKARDFYRHLGGEIGTSRPVTGFGGKLSEMRYNWHAIGALADRA